MATSQQITPDQAYNFIMSYHGHETEFVREVLGSEPYDLQDDIIRAVFKYPKVAVKSCNSAGKSHICADIALTFLFTRPNSIVITTAPTWRQVKDVLWRYMRTRLAKAPVKLTNAQASQVGLDLAEDWFAVGLSTNDAEKFFGYHADEILVIVDEASGVEEEIYVGVDAVTPNVNAKVLMIGNPTNPEGRFYKAFNDPFVKKFTISAFDTPNFRANGIRDAQDLRELFDAHAGVEQIDHFMKVRDNLKMPFPTLADPSKTFLRLEEWGEEHPLWESLVLGEFPSQSSLSLIPLNLILKSVEVWKQIMASLKDPDIQSHPEWKIAIDGQHEFGIDVARFGDDSTVLTPKRGGFIGKLIKWGKLDTSITVDKVIELSSHVSPEWNCTFRIDDTGVGGGVTDQLRKKKRDNPEKYRYEVVPINFAEGTTNPEKYFNYRAEMFDNLAQMFIDHKIAIPDDEELIYELGSIRKEYVGKDNTIMKVESKQKLKDRLKRSPDKADSLALACARRYGGRWIQPQSSNDARYSTEQQAAGISYNHNRSTRPTRVPTITGGLDQRY